MKAIGFFSSIGSSGCTMLSVSFAKTLAARGKSVLHIFGSGTDSYSFIEKNNALSLDDIRLSLIANNLSEDELSDTVKRLDDIYIISSSKKYLLANTFPVNTFQQIIERLRNFDYVIIDAGCDFRTALTMSALCCCDYNVFTLKQQPRCISRFLELESSVLKGFANISVVLNMYINDKALYSEEDIAYLLKRKILASIPFLQLGYYAEIERRTLIQQKKYKRAVDILIDNLIGELNA